MPPAGVPGAEPPLGGLASKPPRMFQWDAVDTSPDLWSQSVRKPFKMAVRHNRRTTQTKLRRVFCRWIYFHLRSKIFFWFSYGGGSPPSPLPTPMDPPLVVTCAERLNRMRCRWRQTRVRPSSQFLSATWRIRQNDLCGGGDRVVAAVTVATCYAPAEQEIGSIDR